MDQQKILAAIGIGSLALMAAKFVGNAAYSNIKFESGAAQVNANFLGQGFLRVTWNVTLTNNNPITATVNSVVGSVKYGQLHVANVSIATPKTLHSGVPTPLQLVFDIQATQFITDFVNSIANQGLGAFINVIKFQGTIYTSLVNVPVNTNISLV
jgi:hypothetical protein